MASPKRMGASGEIAKVLDYAKANGWEISFTRSNHLKLKKKGVRPVFCSYTPSCPRSWLNVIAELRREDRALAENSEQPA